MGKRKKQKKKEAWGREKDTMKGSTSDRSVYTVMKEAQTIEKKMNGNSWKKNLYNIN